MRAMSFDIDLLGLRDKVEPLMRKVGQLQLALFRSDMSVQVKADGSYVCTADLESEALLKDGLHTIIEQADFFAEESGESGNGPYHWVIDPLDGTTNYVRGVPYFCISIALTYNYKPLWAAVYNPIANDFFYAIKGHGCYANGKKISMKQQNQQRKPILIMNLPYVKNANSKKTMDMVSALALSGYAFRYLGAAALDQAYLAYGCFDAILFAGLGWWDIAAGMLLIQEAGGIVTDFQGKEVTYTYASYLAGNSLIHKDMLSTLHKTLS